MQTLAKIAGVLATTVVLALVDLLVLILATLLKIIFWGAAGIATISLVYDAWRYQRQDSRTRRR